MFGVEMREVWDEEERGEFEVSVSARTRALRRRALWVSGGFVGTAALLSVFFAEHPLHRYWESVGKLLLLLSLGNLFGATYCWLMVYGSWAAARETRREME